MASLREFPLAPSMIEENVIGLIFCFFVWPPDGIDAVRLPWPRTDEIGWRIGYTGEIYRARDMQLAADAPPMLITMAMEYWSPLASEPTPAQQVYFGMGLSPQGGQALFHWLPIGQAKDRGPYPDYLLYSPPPQMLVDLALAGKLVGKPLIVFEGNRMYRLIPRSARAKAR